MTTFDPETVDLSALAQALERLVPAPQREGAVVGRTALRNAVAAHLACSDAMAERIVDTMVARGFLTWDDGDVPPGQLPSPGRWRIRPA